MIDDGRQKGSGVQSPPSTGGWGEPTGSSGYGIPVAPAPLVVSPSPRREPPKKPGFFAGMKFFFRGASLLLEKPALVPFAIVPAVAALILIAVFVTLSYSFVPGLIGGLVGNPSAWWSVILQFLATVSAIIISVFLGLALAQPVSSPALEALVHGVEKHLGLPRAEDKTPFWEKLGRSIAGPLVGLGFGTPLLLLGFLLHFIPGGSVVAVPFKFIVAMILIAWDLLDYPLALHGVRLRDRVAFMSRHFGLVMGFTLGIALIALIPCGALLVLPIGVCGATALIAEARRYDDSIR